MKTNRKRFWARLFAILSAALFVLSLLGTLVLELARQSASVLEDQRAAERWGGENAAQFSCFFAKGNGYNPDRIPSLERAVDNALTEASLTAPEGARLWYHAYSTETTMYASAARDSATLSVTVFGGDYFLIHQPALLSGGYLSPGGSNMGYVFLDENAAWKLFGAIDVVGMPLTLAGSEYIVCGVGKIPAGTLYDDAYGTAPRAYILFGSPAASSSEISTYEIVLPEPIEGFAQSILEKQFSSGDNTVIVENSTRFTVPALWEHLKNRSHLGVRTSPVTFPWWENVARVTEFRCASLLRGEIALLTAVGLIVLIWIALLWNPAGRAMKNGLIRLRDAAEDKYNALTRPKKYRDL